MSLTGMAGIGCRERKEEPPVAVAPPTPAQPAAPAQSQPPALPTAPAPPPLSSTLLAGDLGVATQFLKGAYDIQVGTWRWTAPEFDVKLAVPSGAAEKGGALVLKITLPETLIKQHNDVSVKVAVNGVEVSKTASGRGDHVVQFDLPPAALHGDAVVASFTVDKPFVPGGADTRTLGVVLHSVELKSN